MNRNSALIWLPEVVKLGIRSPETELIAYSHREISNWMEDGFKGENVEFNALVLSVIESCLKIGFPCFVRTDLASAKHNGPAAYLASGEASIRRCLLHTIEENELKFWLLGQENGPQYIMVRQFLELDAPFTAFEGLPIAREWRFFVNGKTLICAHPYWPADALRKYIDGEHPSWETELLDLHKIPEDYEALTEQAVKLAEVLGGVWSVDFAMDKTGGWWLIDCAVMQDSWHWPGCKHISKIQ